MTCRPPFLAGTQYPERQRPVWLAGADLNGDGYPDLIAATESNSPPISLRLGNADGTFGPAIESFTGSDANAVLIGKFNADSTPDAIVNTSFGPGFAAGNGDGTFQTATSLPMGNLDSLVAADFNQDGKLDFAGIGGGSVVVVLGNGDGTFHPPMVTDLGDAVAIAVGDVNGDGKPDLVATGTGDTLHVLLGLGNGQFDDQPIPIIVGQFQQSPLLADLDGDGKLDLLLAADFEVKVMLGNGNGTFQGSTVFPAGDFPIALRVGDVDSDGHPDILALDIEATLGIVWILRGVGNGAFVAGGQYAVDSGTNAFVLDDFGNDGRLDIATGGFTLIELSVMLGKGDGTFDGVALGSRRFPAPRSHRPTSTKTVCRTSPLHSGNRCRFS